MCYNSRMMAQESDLAQDWESFEEDCYRYLKAKYPYASFVDLGKHNSNVPDIIVGATHDEFYMEIKKPVAQCGQFVLKPSNGKFVFSQNNKTTQNAYTEKIISEMNRSFDRFSNAGTSGEKINLPDNIFFGWIMDYYTKKGVKYFISKKDDYVIFPTKRFPAYFDVSATYRVKKSGSTNPSSNNLPEILHYSKGKIISHSWQDGKLLIVSSSYSDGDKIEGTRYNYQLNQVSANRFNVRRLSNTANANVIFSISLKKDQDTEDLKHFENNIRA